MEIDGAKILVTGGCGLIGSTTIDLLLREYSPAQIVILDNLNRGTLANVEGALKDARVRLVRGDIRDIPTLAEAIESSRKFLELHIKLWAGWEGTVEIRQMMDG